MNITVIGGTGNTGAAVVAEAARRGHTVTSASRSGRHAEGAAKDATADLTDTAAIVDLINAADATVIAVSPDRTGGPVQPTVDAFKALIAARPTGRLVIVGGAGSLLNADGNRLVDSPDFPAEIRPEALAFSEVLEAFRAAGDALAWTLVSPAPAYPSEQSTGAYVVGKDSPVGANLSPADLAIALVDEIERDAHRGERFAVASA
ncbi:MULTISPECIES: NAD(P)H-binding protein [unclassified Actinomyces]|uniref:NAD(P)-dependent oxidoreductase n=1 Tax=unclassified Actinomyces TaxID=2609248 RepID=UPI001374652E|nr:MULTISPECIES: NAD(P)H-binding protein [unclassified Actinomyces]NDR54324.1 NAD(P)H-binding protein [Actinomyces sp. 565]QHO92049.1 FMN reductase [Actinomyces sp. 432]